MSETKMWPAQPESKGRVAGVVEFPSAQVAEITGTQGPTGPGDTCVRWDVQSDRRRAVRIRRVQCGFLRSKEILGLHVTAQAIRGGVESG